MVGENGTQEMVKRDGAGLKMFFGGLLLIISSSYHDSMIVLCRM